MKVRILEKAEEEVRKAVAYYNAESPGLGYEFLEEFFQTVRRIVRNPRAWQRFSVRTRRAMTKRFPYGVIYQIRRTEILIVAVMHLRRRPPEQAWM